MKYIVIENWEKYQHYGSRVPPWIKLHRNVIEPLNEDGKPNPFYSLSDIAKCALMLLWVRASRTSGVILLQKLEQLTAELGMQNTFPIDELTQKRLIRICSKPYIIKSKTASNGSESDASGFASIDKSKSKTKNKTEIPVDAAAPPADADGRKRRTASSVEDYAAWFDAEISKNFPDEIIFSLGPAYPHVDVRSDIAKARAWAIMRPPSARKRDVKKYIINWLGRSEEHAARRGGMVIPATEEPPMRQLSEAEKQAAFERAANRAQKDAA